MGLGDVRQNCCQGANAQRVMQWNGHMMLRWGLAGQSHVTTRLPGWHVAQLAKSAYQLRAG